MSTSPDDAGAGPHGAIADPRLARVLDAARAVFQAAGRQARIAVEQQDGTVITLTPSPIQDGAGVSSAPALAGTLPSTPQADSPDLQEGPIDQDPAFAPPSGTAPAAGMDSLLDPQALERLRAAVAQAGGDLHVTHAADGWIAVAHLPGTGVDLTSLSPRQREVYDLLLQGLPNRAIARRLALTEGTVRVYVSQVLARLGYASRSELLAEALACR